MQSFLYRILLNEHVNNYIACDTIIVIQGCKHKIHTYNCSNAMLPCKCTCHSVYTIHAVALLDLLRVPIAIDIYNVACISMLLD